MTDGLREAIERGLRKYRGSFVDGREHQIDFIEAAVRGFLASPSSRATDLEKEALEAAGDARALRLRAIGAAVSKVFGRAASPVPAEPRLDTLRLMFRHTYDIERGPVFEHAAVDGTELASLVLDASMWDNMDRPEMLAVVMSAFAAYSVMTDPQNEEGA